MGTLLILMVQAFDLGMTPDAELPTLENLEWMPPHGAEERISIEVFAILTRFDPRIRIDDDWGVGADLKVGLDWGTASSLGFRVGYAGWNTENDSNAPPGGTRVSQYRFGVGGDFTTRHLEFGIYANAGLYHFHTTNVENDTKFFFELEGSIGVRPLPFLKLGVVGMVTWTSSDFNRGSSHLFTQHSIGPAIELRFEF